MFRILAFTTFLLILPCNGISGRTGAISGRSEIALIARVDTECPTTGQTSKIQGDRKIGIVVDSSGSNVLTDPNNLRIAAAKAFNGALVTSADAGPNGKPDQVTVIAFSDTATILYPLGDPAKATFDGIGSQGGTYIAGGLRLAMDELTKTSDTSNRTGIMILTDGEDSDASDLIDQVKRAQSLGIRVAFGFLSEQLPSSSAELLPAILNTGGVYGTVNSAAAQQSFVNIVLAHGPTDRDEHESNNANTVLLPDVSVAATISATSTPRKFIYTATFGEKLDFTISSITGQMLEALVQEVQGTRILGKSLTPASGTTTISLEAHHTADLELLVSTGNTTFGIIFVGVKSNLNRTTDICDSIGTKVGTVSTTTTTKTATDTATIRIAASGTTMTNIAATSLATTNTAIPTVSTSILVRTTVINGTVLTSTASISTASTSTTTVSSNTTATAAKIDAAAITTTAVIDRFVGNGISTFQNSSSFLAAGILAIAFFLLI